MAQKKLSADINNPTAIKIFDIVLGRVLKDIYLNLSESDRKGMEEVFILGSDKEKQKFIEKRAKDFKKFLQKETAEIKAEITREIEKQL